MCEIWNKSDVLQSTPVRHTVQLWENFSALTEKWKCLASCVNSSRALGGLRDPMSMCLEIYVASLVVGELTLITLCLLPGLTWPSRPSALRLLLLPSPSWDKYIVWLVVSCGCLVLSLSLSLSLAVSLAPLSLLSPCQGSSVAWLHAFPIGVLCRAGGQSARRKETSSPSNTMRNVWRSESVLIYCFVWHPS